jgi:putative methionine-R-sulfoxide reductase with GAF domain
VEVRISSRRGHDGLAAPVEERLRRLEAVTDTALSRLEVDDLLPELVDRARDLLEADTAAILLMDESEQFLVASAARGLEEEVVQGSRVPLGRGFAGTVAAERRPVAIDAVSSATVVNPVLLRKGVASMLGVPLMSGAEVLGVLHVGSLRPRSFGAEDVELLERAADRAVVAIEKGRSRADGAAALALQRSLAPQQLPPMPGFELAARYVPGSRTGVGGDWYDVFHLPDGRVGLTMGDVMGHGLRSATVMGRLRSVLRSYALDGDDPATVLTSLDRYLQHFEPGQMATVVHGVLDMTSGTMRVASAGHPAPVLVDPRDGATAIVPPRGIVLGVDAEMRRESVTVKIRAGGMVCLYTDGLLERRGADLDERMRALHRALEADADSAEAVCAEVMVRLLGDQEADDDVALLVARRVHG